MWDPIFLRRWGREGLWLDPGDSHLSIARDESALGTESLAWFHLNHSTGLCLIIPSTDLGNISPSDLVPSSRLRSASNSGSLLHLLEEKLLPSGDLLELLKGNFYHCKTICGLEGSGDVAHWKNTAWRVQGHRFDPAALPPPRKAHPWRWICFFWITYCRCSTDLRFQNLFAFGTIRGIHLSETSEFDTSASNIFWTGKEIEN